MWSLAAFVSALLVIIAIRSARGKVPSIIWGVTAAVFLIGLVPIIGSLYLKYESHQDAQVANSQIYELIVSLKAKDDGTPITDAHLACSIGIKPDRVNDAWEFKIPRALTLPSKEVEVTAESQDGIFVGAASILLKDDFHPTLPILMNRRANVMVSGTVKNASGEVVEHATVSISGHKEHMFTTETGWFELPAHATTGEEITIHVEKRGFDPTNQLHRLGPTPATVVLMKTPKGGL